jgi:hypothetical protein
MSAHQFLLDQEFQAAWELGALSFRELWELQDQLLLSKERLVELPPELESQFNKLVFFQIPAVNRLPL